MVVDRQRRKTTTNVCILWSKTKWPNEQNFEWKKKYIYFIRGKKITISMMMKMAVEIISQFEPE